MLIVQRTGKMLGEKVIRYFEDRLKSRVSMNKYSLCTLYFSPHNDNVMVTPITGYTDGETPSKELIVEGEEE